MQVFNQIRQVLVDSTETGQKNRADVARAAAHAKTVCGLGAGVAGILGLASLVFAVTNPILGGLGAIMWGLAILIGRELFIISGNVENLLSDTGLWGNVVNRTWSAATPKLFVDTIFRNTWVAGPLFSASIIKELEREQPV